MSEGVKKKILLFLYLQGISVILEYRLTLWARALIVNL